MKGPTAMSATTTRLAGDLLDIRMLTPNALLIFLLADLETGSFST
jgi:hypothetical protein